MSSSTILLVEDTDVVRELTAEALELEGYSVLKAATPHEALAIAQHTSHDLLITDLVMQEMRGEELAGRLGAGRPEHRVLYMSGYAGAETLPTGACFLQKPFMLDELYPAVGELLEQTNYQAQP
jgi:two-component system, cell cycle sensor histidine kinase and response regulator CckA